MDTFLDISKFSEMQTFIQIVLQCDAVSLLQRKISFLFHSSHYHFVNVPSISTTPIYFMLSHFIKVWNFCQTLFILHCPRKLSTIDKSNLQLRGMITQYLTEASCLLFLRYSLAIITSKTTKHFCYQDEDCHL